jgi:hypothetical protein
MDINNFIKDMDFNGDHDLNVYNRCAYGKHHCTPFLLNEGSHAKEILGHVHRNLCGPMATSHGREKHFKTFIDDFHKKTFLYTMKEFLNKCNKIQ